MLKSVEAGHVVTLDRVDCIIDGLRVKKVGDHNVAIVRQAVDEIVTLPDAEIFDAGEKRGARLAIKLPDSVIGLASEKLDVGAGNCL